MRAYFISDLHIKVESKQKGQKLLEFLKKLPQDTTHLILLGDIFDMWIGPHDYYVKKFPNIILELKKLQENGIDIHYFEGNHDLHLKKFWEDLLGITVHTDAFYFNLDGITVRAEHGDKMNPDDKGYLFLRWFLRTKVMDLAVHLAPGKLVEMIGERGSKVSRVYSDRQTEGYKEKFKKITRDYAQKVFKEKPFDIFISGHTHVDDDFLFDANSKKMRSINLGSWLDQPKAFVMTPTEQKIITL